jgi:hypothetical protein
MLYIFCVWDAFEIRKTQEYLASNVFPYFKFCNTIIYNIPPLEYHQKVCTHWSSEVVRPFVSALVGQIRKIWFSPIKCSINWFQLFIHFSLGFATAWTRISLSTQVFCSTYFKFFCILWPDKKKLIFTQSVVAYASPLNAAFVDFNCVSIFHSRICNCLDKNQQTLNFILFFFSLMVK